MHFCKVVTGTAPLTDVLFLSIGGAANAYIPTPEEEEREKKIQEQEAELIRVRTQSKDRVREIGQERQELRKESPSS